MTLRHIVRDTLNRKDRLLRFIARHDTPFYLYDQEAFQNSLRSFLDTFCSYIDISPYYAVKANPHELLLKEAVRCGFGLDVSSGRELRLALEAGAKRILYTGPAKSVKDLKNAVAHSDVVIINIDSFQELRYLGELAERLKRSTRCGVRIYTKHHGSWYKFGIQLNSLSRFFQEAARYPYLQLTGIQTHMSFNESPTPYVEVIRETGSYIRDNLTKEQKRQLRFFDFGGGFCPHKMEGVYPWDTPGGKIVRAVDEILGTETTFPVHYYIDSAPPLKSYAKEIARALMTYITPYIDVDYFCEPGRVIAQPAMHLVLSISDMKENGVVITDGATNMVGWEKFETNYAPVINLTHPSLSEKAVRLYGSLCTPNDIWGFYCFTGKMETGDILIIPNQGAYVYTYAQNFIHPIPKVYTLSS